MNKGSVFSQVYVSTPFWSVCSAVIASFDLIATPCTQLWRRVRPHGPRGSHGPHGSHGLCGPHCHHELMVLMVLMDLMVLMVLVGLQ